MLARIAQERGRRLPEKFSGEALYWLLDALGTRVLLLIL